MFVRAGIIKGHQHPIGSAHLQCLKRKRLQAEDEASPASWGFANDVLGGVWGLHADNLVGDLDGDGGHFFYLDGQAQLQSDESPPLLSGGFPCVKTIKSNYIIAHL